MAPDVTVWPLSYHDPLPIWTRGKVALLGDAAHPVRSAPPNYLLFCHEVLVTSYVIMQMLPFGAQGANQAIEDAGALGALFSNGESVADVPSRLRLFEQVRRLRASRGQSLSRVRLGKEKEVEDRVRLYAEPPNSGAYIKQNRPLLIYALYPCYNCKDELTSTPVVPTSFAERLSHDYK